MEQTPSEGGKIWILGQVTSLLLAISILLFTAVIFGAGSSLWELNVSLPILAIVIVLLSFALLQAGNKRKSIGRTERGSLENIGYKLFYAFLIAFLAMITLILVGQQVGLGNIVTQTQYTTSSIIYMVLGLLAAVAIAIAWLTKTDFITWEKTNIWREMFFVGVALWMVFGITFYLSIAHTTPFETTQFSTITFATLDVQQQLQLTEDVIKGSAGFIEGNFFFTFLLGVLSAVGLKRLFPTSVWWKRAIVVAAIAAVFGWAIGQLHTGLYDPSQSDVLFFISFYFGVGALVTLYFETSLAFTVGQGALDFIRTSFANGSSALGWGLFTVVSIIAVIGLVMWQLEKR